MTETATVMNSTFTSLSFRSGSGSPDNEFIRLANEFANLPQHEGISPTPVLRNFFLRKLKEAIAQSTNRNRAAS